MFCLITGMLGWGKSMTNKTNWNHITKSRRLQIWWGQERTELHIQSDTLPARSDALCFEEYYSPRCHHGPASQNLHRPMKTPVLKTQTYICITQCMWFNHTEHIPGLKLPSTNFYFNAFMFLPSSVRANVCASRLPQATWTTRWPNSTFTWKPDEQKRYVMFKLKAVLYKKRKNLFTK